MNSALTLAAARVAIGGAALAAPQQLGRVFRLDPAGNPQLPYMTRLFGTREVALGAAVLLSRGRTRQALVLAGVAVDLGDTVAGWLAGEEGSVDRTSAYFLAGPALGAALAGLVGVRGAG